MNTARLEQRVAALELRYARILDIIQEQPAKNAWRSVVGMFADDPQIEELHEETQRIRREDRADAHNQEPGEV